MRIFTAVISTLLAAIPLAAQEQKQSWNFDLDSLGTLPRGFTAEVGEWKVVADTTAPSRSKALAQVAENSGSTYNLVLVSDTTFQDMELSVKVKAVAGEEDQGGGLVWRARDAENYYIARYNPLEDNYRVYKVEKGRRTQFQSATAKLDPGWHTLRVMMKDDHIQCYLDGKLYLDVRAPTFPEAGRIGLWTKADAQTHFDDLVVAGH
jgi:hypothetical protein